MPYCVGPLFCAIAPPTPGCDTGSFGHRWEWRVPNALTKAAIPVLRYKTVSSMFWEFIKQSTMSAVALNHFDPLCTVTILPSGTW